MTPSNRGLLTVRSEKTRRSFWYVAAMAIGLILATAPLPLAGGAAAEPQIEGTWLVTVTPAGGVPPPFPSLMTYSTGGGVVVTDSSFPPAQGNIYQGTWTRKGGHEFEFTFLGFQYDSTGALSGYVRVYETVRLGPGGDVYNGAGEFQLLDLNQNVVFSEGDTTRATRIK